MNERKRSEKISEVIEKYDMIVGKCNMPQNYVRYISENDYNLWKRDNNAYMYI